MYVIASCFSALFIAMYLMVFFRFIGTLRAEVSQTHELVNMIPGFVLERNRQVREQVWSHKGVV